MLSPSSICQTSHTVYRHSSPYKLALVVLMLNGKFFIAMAFRNETYLPMKLKESNEIKRSDCAA